MCKRHCSVSWLVLVAILCGALRSSRAAMTMKQLDQALSTMRNGCSPKFPSLSVELLDSIKTGAFDDNNKDMKCYIRCIAEMAGTLTKKSDLDIKKSTIQIDSVLPAELREHAKFALETCKDVTKSHKDPCDKVYYAAKCTYDAGPDKFMFP